MKREKFDTGKNSIYWQPVSPKLGSKIDYKKFEDLKNKIPNLPYIERLRYMDLHLGGLMEITNEKGETISTMPDKSKPEEIKLYNERFIKLIENSKGGKMFFYDHLKQGFKDKILRLSESNPYPENMIKKEIQKQIDDYTERLKDYVLQWTIDKYDNDFDLSKEIIDMNFLKARAWPNYLGYLKEQLNEFEARRGRAIKKYKEYKSLTRARAFCINKILELPQYREYTKKDIIKFVKELWPEQSGQTVYEERNDIFNNFEGAKKKYKLDYEYGMKLFKQIYPEK